MTKRQKKKLIFLLLTLLVGLFLHTFNDSYAISNKIDRNYLKETYDIENIPDYSGQNYVVLNSNIPTFTDEEKNLNTYVHYGNLDFLGRCTIAQANLNRELMPTRERESIGQIRPTGWQTVRYDDVIEDKYLYNRCHLIGFQLAGENANPKNLITCTRQMNVSGMLPFENKVSNYIKRTNNHVLYKITPVFKDNNLLASGVIMEAYSVEDQGKGISFNVYVYNNQNKIAIDYKTGNSKLLEEVK